MLLVCVTGLSRGKFPVLNIRGYVNKNQSGRQNIFFSEENFTVNQNCADRSVYSHYYARELHFL